MQNFVVLVANFLIFDNSPSVLGAQVEGMCNSGKQWSWLSDKKIDVFNPISPVPIVFNQGKKTPFQTAVSRELSDWDT